MSKRKRYGSKTLSKRRRVDPAVVFEHKELWVEDFETTAAFTLGTINRINPGLASLFTLLARIARNFEEYEFDYLRLRFGSRRANEKVGGSPAEGTIIVAVIHNSETRLTEFPNNKADMESIWGAKSFNPCYDFIFPIDVKHKNVLSRRYVRTNSAIPAKDNRLDDVGVLLIATAGSASTIEVGDLFLEYRIRLYKPYESPVLRSEFPEDDVRLDHWMIEDMDNTHSLGAVQNKDNHNHPEVGTTLSADTITFTNAVLDEHYLIQYWFKDDGETFQPGDVNGYQDLIVTDCVEQVPYVAIGPGFHSSTTQNLELTGAPATCHVMHCSWIVKITGPNPTAQLDANATPWWSAPPTGNRKGDLYIIRLGTGSNFAP